MRRVLVFSLFLMVVIAMESTTELSAETEDVYENEFELENEHEMELWEAEFVPPPTEDSDEETNYWEEESTVDDFPDEEADPWEEESAVDDFPEEKEDLPEENSFSEEIVPETISHHEEEMKSPIDPKPSLDSETQAESKELQPAENITNQPEPIADLSKDQEKLSPFTKEPPVILNFTKKTADQTDTSSEQETDSAPKSLETVDPIEENPQLDQQTLAEILAETTSQLANTDCDKPAIYFNDTREAHLPELEIPLYTDINGKPASMIGLFTAVLRIPFGFIDFELKEAVFKKIISHSDPCHARFTPDNGILIVPQLEIPTIITSSDPVNTTPSPVIECSALLQQSNIRIRVLSLKELQCSPPTSDSLLTDIGK